MTKARALVVALALGTPFGAMAGGVERSSEACAQGANAIRVIVKGIRKADGTITADLHGDKPDEFLKKGKKILRVRAPARVGSVEICLPAPRPGVFAVGIYHDVNGNRKFDKNFLGLPAEPYGVSNDPAMRLGPPRHEDASFAVGPRGTTVEVTLRHGMEPDRLSERN